MNIVFFSHPDSLNSRSMPRFTNMLANSMKKRGHQVEIWSPSPFFHSIPTNINLKKWLGYIDQFIKFPLEIRKRLKVTSSNTLYVFTDHALGPWVPLVSHLPHVIHCHDFLAQYSAKGLIEENPVKWTGRLYQSYIYRGYSHGKNFITVSKKTEEDLQYFLPSSAQHSEVVYNGLNPDFHPTNIKIVREKLSITLGINLTKGFLLHVGGNEWYKNRTGVIEIYNAWRKTENGTLPLLLIGPSPNYKVIKQFQSSSYKNHIYFKSNIEDDQLCLAYAGATVFLFPSLAEGFGWPIAEAMASGCPVITTQEAPMTEVGGDSAFYIPRRPIEKKETTLWANQGAQMINKIINMPKKDLKEFTDKAIFSSQRFDKEMALDKIETIYKKILNF